jgi:autotransporter-associated beta strand protein
MVSTGSLHMWSPSGPTCPTGLIEGQRSGKAVALTAFLLTLSLQGGPVVAAERTWIGNTSILGFPPLGGDGWGNSLNWDSGVPVSGDSLKFINGQGTHPTSFNNLTNLQLQTITYGMGRQTTTMSGNAFRLTGGVNNLGTNQQFINAPITLQGNTSWSTANLGRTIVGGVLSGTGALTTTVGSSGTLELRGVNTYTGATTISGGALELSSTGRLSDTTLVTVNSGATFRLSGAVDTVGSLSGTGSVDLIGAGAALTVGGDNLFSSFDGVISGAGSFGKTGSGTLTLQGASTYTGATTISGGSVTLQGSGRLSDSTAVTVNSGGALIYSAVNDTIGSLAGGGSVSLLSSALTVGGIGMNTGALHSGVISGNGSLTKIGGSTQALDGANTYSGGTFFTHQSVI